ncbi:short-chain dehydrogenase [Chryseobacterium shigense]|uniref:NAD(P)-dependent dehydrogenase, short-chain alcohol dehydrogenase family n=1 Tax=Chryseobacterium shigense TaxID=297244 RepID=A0A1N7K378_9FLAO|nr:glucose 1-dehydrogenase [Chryseobacterium shigense]PQA91089.1 short-chain dehydrogenase [Chryseobacterium shigense]SIS56030.1 NAD(P)-dependent dehydrogenase, short-chain alcohol dehydrogenase family [Chryseobacterium shigense]
MGILESKVALVTGAGSGIGLAVAQLYAREGAKVIVSDINKEHGKEAVEKIKSEGGEASFVKADTSSAEDVESLVRKTAEIYGRLDIACNNAGIGGEAALTGDYSLDSWRKVLSVNLDGVFYGCKYEILEMEKNGGGVIINMASIHGTVAAPLSSAYTTAKHAVVGLTKNIGAEYGQKGIRCNAVGPGYIDTPLLQEMEEDKKEVLVAKHPIGRLGTAQEVAELVLFLSSDKSSFITGAYYLIDGGYTAV